MIRHTLFRAAVLALLTTPVAADEISDTIQSALDAYNQGDVQYATEELAFAQQLLNALKTEGLAAFLPPPPDGWTRELDEQMGASLGMMGGGVGAAADYVKGNDKITVTMMADNPMVTAMAGMMGNPVVMASMGKIVRVGREKFLDQEGQLSALINNRVLVRAEGADPALMITLLETIDFKSLGDFGN
jgi:hypothetical protein